MPPSNISFATALDIGTTLPFSISQDVSGIVADPSFKVYYKYTAQPDDIVIGVWAKTPVSSNYDTFMLIYLETSPGVWNEYDLFIEPFQVPCQVPVTPGETYFFEVYQDNAGVTPDEDLTFSVLPAPSSTLLLGSLLISDFSPGFPGVVLSPSDGSILSFQNNIKSADFGDILPSGIMGWLYNGTNPFTERIIDTDFSTIAEDNGLTNNNTGQQIRANGDDLFYVAKSTSVAAATVGTISDAGVEVGPTWTLPADSRSITGMAPNRADTILYYGGLNGGSNALHAYDLIGLAPLADLVAAIPNYTIRKDVLVMSDGTILVAFNDHLAPIDEFVKQYNPAGTLLNTFSLPTGESLDRIALDVDDSADTFWMMTFPNNEVIRFKQIQISDGSTLVQFDVTQFNNGVSEQTYADDMDRFGISNSCPLIILRTGDTPPPPSGEGGIYKIVPNSNKTNDTLWDSDFIGTHDVKIP